MMNGGMNRIDFNCGCDIESSLLETDRHSASTGKQINANRSFIHCRGI